MTAQTRQRRYNFGVLELNAPTPLAAKQKLMELDEPLVRLQLVDEFLRSKGVVG